MIPIRTATHETKKKMMTSDLVTKLFSESDNSNLFILWLFYLHHDSCHFIYAKRLT